MFKTFLLQLQELLSQVSFTQFVKKKSKYTQHHFYVNYNFDLQQRTGALSPPQMTGLLLPLPRLLTGVAPLPTGLKAITMATIKVFCTLLYLLFLCGGSL